MGIKSENGCKDTKADKRVAYRSLFSICTFNSGKATMHCCLTAIESAS